MSLLRSKLQERPTSRQLQILIVEDDEIDFLITRKQLRKIDDFEVDVDWGSSCEEACSELQSKDYDILFVDYRLGAVSGLEFLEILNKQKINIPTVMLTGYWDKEIDTEAIKKGASDYLIKSEITPSLLERSIRYAIERHDKNEKLETVSRIDFLTELLNRRGFEDILEKETNRKKRENNHPIAILIDLDNFKNINDTFGYSVGDIVLKETAQNLKKTLRPSDYCARIGGDEFMILLPDAREAEGMAICERIRLCLSKHVIELNDKRVTVTASIGWTPVDKDILSIDSLLSELNLALKKSKLHGKNYVSSNTSDGPQTNRFNQFLDDLQTGKGLYSVSQSLIDLKNRKIIGYEMLSRSHSEDFKTPDDFFRLSMEKDILGIVDLNCIIKSLDKIKGLKESCEIHLNIFPSTLISSFSDKLVDLLTQKNSRHKICLEISEQQIIGNPSYLKESLQKLKDKGIHIAIDDVGFGKSSLESLIFLNPDTVKIDKSCVTGASSDACKRGYLKKLISVAQALNINVVAEGIETEEDLKLLVELGIPFGQGYLFGKPVESFASQN